jgi:hypothetical protein
MKDNCVNAHAIVTKSNTVIINPAVRQSRNNMA